MLSSPHSTAEIFGSLSLLCFKTSLIAVNNFRSSEVRRDAETLDTLARVLFRLGRWNDARKAVREALETGVRDAEIFYRAGIIEEALGNEDGAIAYFQLAKETNPTFDELTGKLLGLYR